MKLFRSYKRTKFFLWINIVGLSIGLAVSITLILYVLDQLSYDKHFENHNRIVRLLTVAEDEGGKRYMPINLVQAYTELPSKVPGVEAATEIYDVGRLEVIVGGKRYQGLRTLMAEPELPTVFSLKFLEGNASSALSALNSAIITRRQADVLFGGIEQAMGQTIVSEGLEFTVSGVVEELPKNTHFSFDALVNINVVPFFKEAQGLEFHTYYLIRRDASLDDTRRAIEREYTALLEPWCKATGLTAWGETELLADVYLKSKASFTLDRAGNRTLIGVMAGLALFILILAVTNFINLYISQGEVRMNEVAIRKTNGGQISDIVRQFFSEASVTVLIAFAIGFVLSVLCIHYYIHQIDIKQFASPVFIFSILALFLFTVVFSASYPAFYLSRFSPLDILGKRLRLSKRRLTAAIVIFQSVVSIVLLSFITAMYAQIDYTKNLPMGYNPHQVMSVMGSGELLKSYKAIEDELMKLPVVKSVAVSHHIMGAGYSGQVIAKWNDRETRHAINEYRVGTGFAELMQLELTEGRFWTASDPDSLNLILLNEAAVKMLGGESPLEKTYDYFGEAKVTGVVKDFSYDEPVMNVAPIVLRRISRPSVINIRFAEDVSRPQAEEATLATLRRFDPEFVMEPVWNIDIYTDKFAGMKQYTRIMLIATALSVFIAMLGLLAIHLYSSVRRTKEIGIRRIHGAGKGSVFWKLSINILVWIGIAAVIAIPVAWYFISDILGNFTNHIPVNITLFILPVVIQYIVALLTTSGVTWWVLSRNPVSVINNQ